MRTQKDRPFWTTETQTCWNGSVEINQVMKPEGFCRMNAWLPVALGGEANCFWLWRQHWAGHELNHGSVISPEGRPLHIFGEIRQTAEEFARTREFLSATKVKTGVALHFSAHNSHLFEVQPIVHGMNYTGRVTEGFYLPLNRLGLRPDVIGAEHSLDGYRLLVSPLMMTLEEGDLPARLEAWVRSGGVWVVGPMTDIRNSIGAHYTDRAMGMLERLTGCELSVYAPDNGEMIRAAWQSGEEVGRGGPWYELYTPGEEAETLATVTGLHSALVGRALYLRCRVGRGEIILLGTIPSPEDAARILSLAAADAGIGAPIAVEGDVTVIPREGGGRRGTIIAEVNGREAAFTLPRPMHDLLTGESRSGRVALPPYGLFVLEE